MASGGSSNRDAPAAQAARQVAVAVVQRAGCYLIGQRPPHLELGGLWEFPGGKIKPSETASEAAVRECREETGIEVQITGALGEVTHHYADEDIKVQITFVACEPVKLSAQPKDPFLWVRAAELDRYQFPAANRKILRQIMDALA